METNSDPSNASGGELGGIKRMKLYQHSDRVTRALENRSMTPGALVSPDAFEDLDQLHYEGHEAVDRAVERLGIVPSDTVLDVGAGLGGPARRLAHTVGCRVQALELQEDLDAAGRQFTAACGLDDQVAHVCGDILDPTCEPGPFDALVSWLVFLHIPDRPNLLDRCRKRLKPGGQLYAEDFYLRAPLTSKEEQLLEEAVYCTGLVDEGAYRGGLQEAGFTDVHFEDRTGVWQDFVLEREALFLKRRKTFVENYNEATFEALASFYRTMVTLFSGGRLGGVVLHARAAGV